MHWTERRRHKRNLLARKVDASSVVITNIFVTKRSFHPGRIFRMWFDEVVTLPTPPRFIRRRKVISVSKHKRLSHESIQLYKLIHKFSDWFHFSIIYQWRGRMKSEKSSRIWTENFHSSFFFVEPQAGLCRLWVHWNKRISYLKSLFK